MALDLKKKSQQSAKRQNLLKDMHVSAEEAQDAPVVDEVKAEESTPPIEAKKPEAPIKKTPAKKKTTAKKQVEETPEPKEEATAVQHLHVDETPFTIGADKINKALQKKPVKFGKSERRANFNLQPSPYFEAFFMHYVNMLMTDANIPLKANERLAVSQLAYKSIMDAVLRDGELEKTVQEMDDSVLTQLWESFKIDYSKS